MKSSKVDPLAFNAAPNPFGIAGDLNDLTTPQAVLSRKRRM